MGVVATGNTPSSIEQIGVYYTLVSGAAGSVGNAYHAVLYYENSSGDIQTLQGEPAIDVNNVGTIPSAEEVLAELTGTNGSSTVFGNLTVQSGPNQIPAGVLSNVLITGLDLSSYWDSIKATADQVNDANIAYMPLLVNSNSFVATALSNAGITWIAPYI
jgi:hypothetical protein